MNIGGNLQLKEVAYNLMAQLPPILVSNRRELAVLFTEDVHENIEETKQNITSILRNDLEQHIKVHNQFLNPTDRIDSRVSLPLSVGFIEALAVVLKENQDISTIRKLTEDIIKVYFFIKV